MATGETRLKNVLINAIRVQKLFAFGDPPGQAHSASFRRNRWLMQKEALGARKINQCKIIGARRWEGRIVLYLWRLQRPPVVGVPRTIDRVPGSMIHGGRFATRTNVVVMWGIRRGIIVTVAVKCFLKDRWLAPGKIWKKTVLPKWRFDKMLKLFLNQNFDLRNLKIIASSPTQTFTPSSEKHAADFEVKLFLFDNCVRGGWYWDEKRLLKLLACPFVARLGSISAHSIFASASTAKVSHGFPPLASWKRVDNDRFLNSMEPPMKVMALWPR